jgi:chromosome segregation protein
MFLAGGSIGLGDGKRTGKQKNLQKLSDEIKAHQEVIDSLQKQIAATEKEQTEQRNTFSEAGRNVSKTDGDFARTTGQVNTLKNNREFLVQAIDYTRTTVNQLTEENENLNKPEEHPEAIKGFSIESQRTELQNLLDQQKIKQDLSNELQKHVSDMTNAYNQKNIQFFQQQNKLQNISRDISFKSNQVSNLTRSREEHLD